MNFVIISAILSYHLIMASLGRKHAVLNNVCLNSVTLPRYFVCEVQGNIITCWWQRDDGHNAQPRSVGLLTITACGRHHQISSLNIFQSPQPPYVPQRAFNALLKNVCNLTPNSTQWLQIFSSSEITKIFWMVTKRSVSGTFYRLLLGRSRCLSLR
jgi:hypothetical protein